MVSFTFFMLGCISFCAAGYVLCLMFKLRREELLQARNAELERELELCKRRLNHVPPEPMVFEFPTVQRAAND